MEIAVPDMAEDRRNQTALRKVALCFGDALRKPRNRHADIGGKGLRAGAQRPAGPIGIMPRLP